MKVILFGIAKDIVGGSILDLEDMENTPQSVGDLIEVIQNKFPKFKKLSSLAIAVNGEYASNELSLQAQDEIAIIPPVSGG